MATPTSAVPHLPPLAANSLSQQQIPTGMKVISAEEVAALDANCRYFGLLPLQLMENAGAALAREVKARADSAGAPV